MRNFPMTEEDGFTLVELLVVILIIGILASIAIPVFLNQRKVALEASLKSDIKTLSLAQESSITSESPTGSFNAVALKESFKTVSKGTGIGTWFTDKGYCVVGYNKNSTYPGAGDDQRTYLWFDSALGGYVLPASKELPPAGGACDNPRPGSQQQAWFYNVD